MKGKKEIYMDKYKYLKIARIIFKVLAWVAAGLGLVVGVTVFITGGGAPTALPDGTAIPPPPRATGLIFMLMGALYFLILFTVSEIIGLLLDIKDSCVKPAV